jgi:hypothetical protein
VDIGQSTLFSETGMGGDRDFRGIGYVEPQGFPGVETKGVPCLAGILLKNDEAQIAWDLGLTRVTALLGMKYHYYPCPAWSDLKREPVATLHAMEKSHLWKITRISARASYYEQRNHIFLSVLQSSRASLQGFLNELPPTKPLALRTQPDPSANACLVWPPGHDEPMAITPAGSDGSRKTGAFLAFVPEQDANEIHTVEDGFFLYLTNSAWQKIREALLSGTAFGSQQNSSAALSVASRIPSTGTWHCQPTSRCRASARIRGRRLRSLQRRFGGWHSPC